MQEQFVVRFVKWKRSNALSVNNNKLSDSYLTRNPDRFLILIVFSLFTIKLPKSANNTKSLHALLLHHTTPTILLHDDIQVMLNSLLSLALCPPVHFDFPFLVCWFKLRLRSSSPSAPSSLYLNRVCCWNYTFVFPTFFFHATFPIVHPKTAFFLDSNTPCFGVTDPPRLSPLPTPSPT